MLRPGKLPARLLERLLAAYATGGPRVRLGPAVGEDAAAIELPGGRLLVATADPVTFVAEDLGRYALAVNANDVATRGAEPKWFLGILLLPAGRTAARDVERHFRQLSRACRELGVAMVGGHVEVTPGIARPLLSGFLLGEVAAGRLVTTGGGRPGDDVVLTKGAAIEAVSILARAKAGWLSRRRPPAFLARCRGFIRRISVLPEARIAARLGVHAMHDATEGGVATALWELAHASGLGLEACRERIPVPPEARDLCGLLGLDPLGAIASGALLIACPPGTTRKLLSRLAAARIPAAAVGRLLPRGAGTWLVEGGRRRPLPRFDSDELTRVL